ncbi:MAG: SagB/ThcOx family dehydrogenase [Candidatus Bathyarchaeota archaeon]|nr:SagB/ThcOx family dehydrogenase [Candidatus Bathyarchaeota archaeon]
MSKDVGDRFQQETKYIRDRMKSGRLDWSIKPDTYKSFPQCHTIPLSRPELQPMLPLDTTLKQRKSIRSFTQRPLDEKHLAYLLWASTGVQRQERHYAFRPAPSAGALYPLETYLVLHRVSGIPSGVYHYSIQRHQLEELSRGDFQKQIAQATLGQTMSRDAAVVMIWTAIFQRCKWKYRQRAYRYIYLDAGHVAQNLALTATSLSLGSCQIGAFYDEEVNALLGIDGFEESAIYLSAIGHPAAH